MVPNSSTFQLFRDVICSLLILMVHWEKIFLKIAVLRRPLWGSFMEERPAPASDPFFIMKYVFSFLLIGAFQMPTGLPAACILTALLREVVASNFRRIYFPEWSWAFYPSINTYDGPAQPKIQPENLNNTLPSRAPLAHLRLLRPRSPSQRKGQLNRTELTG